MQQRRDRRALGKSTGWEPLYEIQLPPEYGDFCLCRRVSDLRLINALLGALERVDACVWAHGCWCFIHVSSCYFTFNPSKPSYLQQPAHTPYPYSVHIPMQDQPLTNSYPNRSVAKSASQTASHALSSAAVSLCPLLLRAVLALAINNPEVNRGGIEPAIFVVVAVTFGHLMTMHVYNVGRQRIVVGMGLGEPGGEVGSLYRERDEIAWNGAREMSIAMHLLTACNIQCS